MLLEGGWVSMATDTRAELEAAFHYLGEGGLDDFEPEAPRASSWLRVANPSLADIQRWEPLVASGPVPRSWHFVVPVVAAAAIAGSALSWGLFKGVVTSERTALVPSRTASPPLVREPATPTIAPVYVSPQMPEPVAPAPAT